MPTKNSSTVHRIKKFGTGIMQRIGMMAVYIKLQLFKAPQLTTCYIWKR